MFFFGKKLKKPELSMGQVKTKLDNLNLGLTVLIEDFQSETGSKLDSIVLVCIDPVQLKITLKFGD